MDFWISEWISGFQIGFLDFSLDFWISGFQFGNLYEISFVTDPSPTPAAHQEERELVRHGISMIMSSQ